MWRKDDSGTTVSSVLQDTFSVGCDENILGWLKSLLPRQVWSHHKDRNVSLTATENYASWVIRDIEKLN